MVSNPPCQISLSLATSIKTKDKNYTSVCQEVAVFESLHQRFLHTFGFKSVVILIMDSGDFYSI